MAFVIGYINRGISTSIGVVAEKYYDHRDRKAALSLFERTDPDDITSDEAVWALDEAADLPTYEEATERPAVERSASDAPNEALVRDIIPANFEATRAEINAQQQNPEQQGRLHMPYPIVIPQRRPGAKTRGFARAYPPDLADLGIDQETFLHFLDNFQKSSKASGWLNALYISAGAIGFVPGTITLAVSISMQVAVGTAIELQGRYRANAFLDEVNKELFMPLGLYAMVLMYKRDGPGTKEHPAFGVETVNVQSAKSIAKWGLPEDDKEDDGHAASKKNEIIRPIRLTSGHVKGSDMPTVVAPLVYPGLEDMLERPDLVRDESFGQRLKRNKQWVVNYFDRRAQAEYAGNNPDSALAKAGSEQDYKFKSKFSDPNHPVNNGHLFSLITGGRYVAQPLGNRRLREKGEDGKLKPAPPKPKPFQRGGGGVIGLAEMGVNKILTEDVLYLTIVNLPSDEELAEARKILEADQGRLSELIQALRGKTKGTEDLSTEER